MEGLKNQSLREEGRRNTRKNEKIMEEKKAKEGRSRPKEGS